MENTFSTNAAETMQREINMSERNCSSTCEDIKRNIASYFDVHKSVGWIIGGRFKRVALQFPDELLEFSVDVCKELQRRCSELDAEESKDRYVFILGDTSYGSCCVDVVASEHYNADSLIHYGHSCLSLVDKLPVFYVFEKYELDFGQLKAELDRICDLMERKEYTETKIEVIFDVSYHHLHDSLKKLENDRIHVSALVIDNKDSDSFVLHSRTLSKSLQNQDERPCYLFFYIGNKDPFLNSFQLYFNKNRFLSYNTNTLIAFKETNRKLMRRFYLIEKAKDSQIFGILVGTMAIAKYKEAIDHAGNILRKAKRKFYSFLIGKLNCAKLNNFMEVDMYVLIACNENSLLDSKEFNKPVITLYELEIAFNCSRLWGEEFVSDYAQLLSGMKHHKPLELSTSESDISLISGEVRYTKTTSGEDTGGALMKRDDALSVVHHAGAGEFLQKRSWTGLEQSLGQTAVVSVVEGRKGIAMEYENEEK